MGLIVSKKEQNKSTIKNNWFVYMLRCADNSLYTGITTDLDRRLDEHNGKKSLTRYTRVRQPVQLVYKEVSNSRSSASQREAQIKKLSKAQKEEML